MVFTGDLVNTNWAPNVSAVAARISTLPCPTRLVTGNHDIYLNSPGSRLQEAIKPGDYPTGFRHEIIDDVGLLYLDLFVHHENSTIAKVTDPHDRQAGTLYRQQDVDDALTVLDSEPGRRYLAIGHFPMMSPDERLRRPDRKIGWNWPSARALAQRLDQSSNLLGIVCGHQHFAHFQRRIDTFHWTLPALVEYPCAAGILVVNGADVSGRIVMPDEELADLSLSITHANWTAGEAVDRSFSVAYPS